MAASKKNSGLKRVALVVSGRVQGVGFRFFTRERAEERGVSGWVRNRYDGNVEMEAQGSPEQIEQFIADLWEGPMFGHVDDVQQHTIPAVSGEDSFMVRL
jgi:acylphosphatase